ncbi:outer membrane beta-barrel protein [Pedobacter sp. SYSU D00535]|uniref:outer membrane beta-barrel protein n=1 Tax=Pedobacter sp. SYSU D00535 TaxID=2810308 RepID=UPI001A971557|nr:outer membrane beta-barrel protein [Pedobacter sp. SYSU D00535]
MKKNFTLLLLFLSAAIANAQAIRPFSAIDLGAGLSMNTATGDAETFRRTQSFHLNLSYNIDPYLNAIAEVQSGSLAGGDSLRTITGRQFLNRFNALNLRGQLQLGMFLPYSKDPITNLAKNIYTGVGIGMIMNNITDVNRRSSAHPDFFSGGVNRSMNVFVPVRLGYEFKIQDAYRETRMKIDLAYTHNFVLGDEVDGFTVGRYKDAISQLTLGFKACLFGKRWYRQHY